tara:strand:- start:707 stop:1042 length:336 start_codon:yes stop_codon:yes gene_type:complete
MVYEFFGRGRLSRGKEKGIFDLSHKDKRKLSKMGDDFNKMRTRNREKQKIGAMSSGVSTGHAVVPNHRLLAHRANVILPRGSDSRHKQQGRVDQIRHAVANDKIIVDRPLG